MSECTAKKCRIKEFLNRQHTPLEKGLMITAGFALGLATGLLLSPACGGIEISPLKNMEMSIGSRNGRNNGDK